MPRTQRAAAPVRTVKAVGARLRVPDLADGSWPQRPGLSTLVPPALCQSGPG
jgi:hypothetical protein